MSKNGLEFNINDKTEWNVLIAKGKMASNNDQVARHGFFANDRRIHQNINFFRSDDGAIDDVTDSGPDSIGTAVIPQTTDGKKSYMLRPHGRARKIESITGQLKS